MNENEKAKAEAKAKFNKELRKRKIVNRILLIAQLFAGFLALILLAGTNAIPTKYFGAAVVLLIAVWILCFLLLVMSARQRNQKKAKGKRRFGITLSAIAIIGSLIISGVSIRAIQTMEGMNDTTQKIKIGVYVLADDEAENLEDAKDYSFGVSTAYDYKNSLRAIENINEQLKSEITTQDYEAVSDEVDALYAGGTKAIILNEAYIDVLTDMKKYRKFEKKTKQIAEIVLEVEANENAKSDVTKEPFVVYLSGSDTRDTKLTTSRSDVNILAVVNPITKQILLVNTPRDYRINILIDGVAKGDDKLTHCGIYGIDCSMENLGALYNVEVNYYAQINFTGIIKLVDELGGITVESDRDFVADDWSTLSEKTYHFTKGTNELDGDMALGFARQRHGMADGDLARGVHQMAVIKGIANKAMSPEILKSWSGVLSSIEGMVATSMTKDEMGSLVNLTLDSGMWEIKSYAVTGENGSGYTYSMPKSKCYIMEHNETEIEQAKQLMQKVLNGETLTDEDLKKTYTE